MRSYSFILVLILFLTPAVILASGENAVPNPSKQIVMDTVPDEALEQAREKSEKFEFQAEVNRMMKLIIHSLYKAKEIFLRELISNASDALDKIRFMSLTKPQVLGSTTDLAIYIKSDLDSKTITITDTGIGMTKKDLIKNLGTIAKSGTAEFLTNVEKNSDSGSNLIGQFGVGFYSAFLVADKVTVISKHNDDKQHIWESYAESDFTVVEDPRGDTLGRGTQIVLHLKDDADEYLNDAVLEEIIRKYSEFINFPIYLWVNKTDSVEVPMTEEEIAEKEEEEKPSEVEVDAENGEEKVSKPSSDTELTPEEKEARKEHKKIEYRWYYDWELMNPQRPIWTRTPSNVTQEEYDNFYKSVFEQSDAAMSHLHFHAEGDVEFSAILFIPKTQDQEALHRGDKQTKNIKLFVKRVFITDELLDFMPRWLGFIKGMIDSDDLPLNVSRETLQKHRLLKLIRRKVIRKCLDLIKDLSYDDGKYENFLKEYGVNVKLGVIEDAKNRKKILKLLRVKTSKSSKKISLDTYLARMKPKQEQIYYLTGSTVEEIKKSPFVERLVARGYEVIFFDEPIDEYLVQALREYQQKHFHNVAKAGLKIPDEQEIDEETQDAFVPLVKFLQVSLNEYVEKVVLSNRLLASPAALIASQMGWSGHMEKLMANQALKNANDDMLRMMNAKQKKTLEINPKHPLIKTLLEKVKENRDDQSVIDNVWLLFEMTQIKSGFEVDSNDEFVSRIERVMRNNMGVDINAVPEGVNDVTEDEDEPSTAEKDKAEEVEASADEDSSASEDDEYEKEVQIKSRKRRHSYTAEKEATEFNENKKQMEEAEKKAEEEAKERLAEEQKVKKSYSKVDDEEADDRDEL